MDGAGREGSFRSVFSEKEGIFEFQGWLLNAIRYPNPPSNWGISYTKDTKRENGISSVSVVII